MAGHETSSAILAYMASFPKSFFVLLLLVAFALQRLAIYYRLRNFKGPFWGSFSKAWMVRACRSGNFHLELAHVCEEYGTIPSIHSMEILLC